MTTTELAAEVFARQGYLVIARQTPLEMGSVLSGDLGTIACMAGVARLPFRVIGASCPEEFEAQCDLVAGLRGEERFPFQMAYQYRIEALD